MNKVLVISGGSRGIGLAAIKRFASEGYQIINLSRQQPALEGITHLNVDLADINWPNQHRSSLIELVKEADLISLIHNAAKLAKIMARGKRSYWLCGWQPHPDDIAENRKDTNARICEIDGISAIEERNESQ